MAPSEALRPLFRARRHVDLRRQASAICRHPDRRPITPRKDPCPPVTR
ncbi:putative leader peptide [Pseudonocardia lutea]|uniref:Leader peptide n=1 Tax=Pseudonocardia lutea TaxID=2172015 RepID=A0ABW1IHU5_9PSEU